MKCLLRVGLVVLLLTTAIGVEGQEKNKKDRRREVDLKAGSVAPDFIIKDLDGKNAVKLSALKGKPVVLIFGSCT